MTTKLKTEITREVTAITMDSGKRNLIVSVKNDVIEVRAKGLSRIVVFGIRYLYEQGIKDGRVRKTIKTEVKGGSSHEDRASDV